MILIHFEGNFPLMILYNRQLYSTYHIYTFPMTKSTFHRHGVSLCSCTTAQAFLPLSLCSPTALPAPSDPSSKLSAFLYVFTGTSIALVPQRSNQGLPCFPTHLALEPNHINSFFGGKQPKLFFFSPHNLRIANSLCPKAEKTFQYYVPFL